MLPNFFMSGEPSVSSTLASASVSVPLSSIIIYRSFNLDRSFRFGVLKLENFVSEVAIPDDFTSIYGFWLRPPSFFWIWTPSNALPPSSYDSCFCFSNYEFISNFLNRSSSPVPFYLSTVSVLASLIIC